MKTSRFVTKYENITSTHQAQDNVLSIPKLPLWPYLKHRHAIRKTEVSVNGRKIDLYKYSSA